MSSKIKSAIFVLIHILILINSCILDSTILSSDVISKIGDIAFILAVALIVYNFIHDDIDIKTTIIIAISMILICVSAGTSRDTSLYYVLIMALAFKGCNINKLLLADVIVRTIVVTIQIYSFISINGFVAFGSRGNALRYALGFNHPNTLAFMLLLIALDILYLCRNKKPIIKIVSYIFGFIMLFTIYKLTVSRTSIIILAFSLFMFIMFNFKMDFLSIKPIKIFLSLSYFLLFIFSYFLVHLYESGTAIGEKINNLFSTRLYLCSYYTKIFGLTLFGQRVGQGGNTPLKVGDVVYYTIDNAYVWGLLTFGIITSILLGILFFFAIKKTLENKNYHLFILILTTLAYGVTEQGAIKYYINYLVVLISYGIYYFNEKDTKKLILPAPIKSFVAILGISLFVFIPHVAENTSFFLLSNANEQYSFLLSYWQKFHDLDFSLYDWSLDLGASVFNIIKTGILNPINLLILFFPKSSIQYVYIFLNIFKLCTLGVFSSLWLSKISNNKSHILLVSILIALSGLAINSIESSLFEVYTLLPLVLYTTELFIKDNKKIPFIISLFILLICGPTYSSIIILITSLYIIVRCALLNNTKKGIKLLIMLILSVGLSCVILIPSLNVGTSGIQGLNNDLINSLLSILVPFNSIDSSNFGYLSIYSLTLLPLLFINRNKKESIILSIYLLINIILCLSLKGVLGNSVIYLLIISFAYIFINLIDTYNPKDYRVWLISTISISLIMFILYLIFGNTYYELTELNTLYMVVIIATITFVIFTFKTYGIKALGFVIIFDVCLSYFYYQENMEIVDYYDYSYNYVDTLKDIKKDDSLYRIAMASFANRNTDKSSDTYSLNKSSQDLINNLAGVSTNSSTYNEGSKEYIDLISNGDPSNNLSFDKNNLSFYNAAGVKYYTNSNTKAHRDKLGRLALTTPEETSDPGTLAINNADLISDDNYILRNYGSNLVLTAKEDGSLTLEEYNDSDLQTWHVTHYNGSLVIYNMSTNKRIDSSDGALFQNDNNDESPSQKWVAIDRDNKYEIITSYDVNECISGNGSSIYIDTYTKSDSQYWEFVSTNEIFNTSIPGYYTKVEDKDYFVNNYYIELGYVNNNTINKDAISEYPDLEKERITREYVVLEDSTNTTYTLHDELNCIQDYIYASPFYYECETPLSNVTLTIYNNASPIVNVKLYDGDTLVKEENFHQYNYCNVDIDETMSVTKIIVEHTDPLNQGYSISMYTSKKQDQVEETLYNQRIQNSFTNIKNKDTKITADINISEDNSLVYTYIPYDDNWTIKVDGQEVSKLKANYGFTAFYLNSGNHSVEFNYKISGLNTGLIISGISLVGLIVFIIIDKNKSKAKRIMH